jgi:O-antigen/teichoic acid export membrane protein
MMTLLRAALRLGSWDSTRVAAWNGAGGVALMTANLLLAGVLSADDFGRLTLVIAMLSLGVGMGPLGFNSLIVRREIPPEWRSLFGMAALASVPAAVLGIVGYAVYDLGAPGSGLVLLGCIGGVVGLLCSSFDRADVRLDRAQAVSQLPLLVFLAGASLLPLVEGQSWLIATALIAGGYLSSGAVGLLLFGRRCNRHTGGSTSTIPQSWGERPWGERLRRTSTFLGIGVSSLVLSQVERFIIPRSLGLEELALFGVAATLVLGPFKLLQGGIGYALMPRLHGSTEARQRRMLVRKELGFAVATSAVLAVLVVAFVPVATEFLYSDKYSVGTPLVLVLALIGTLRAMCSVPGAVVLALGQNTQLKQYHGTGWASIAVAIGAGYALAPLGLVGLLGGIALGWAARGFVGAIIARNAFRAHDSRGPTMPRASDGSVSAKPV